MRLGRKLRRFLNMTRSERRLLLEAVAFLALARAAILVVPFRRLARTFQRTPHAATCDGATIEAVRRAVETAARNVPWNAVCLPQAMAAKAMLARRGYSSALHLGAARRKGEALTAHAWLVADGKVVVGEAGIDGVAPLARFG